MRQRRNHLLGLGAAAMMLSTPFIVSSCQTMGAGVREEKTMMKGESDEDTLKSECPCASLGDECECEAMDCSSSCGGEGLEALLGDGS